MNCTPRRLQSAVININPSSAVEVGKIGTFTSTRPGVRPLVSNLVMTHHAPGYWRGIALARWLWSDQDDLAWGTCDGEVCCKSNGFELE